MFFHVHNYSSLSLASFFAGLSDTHLSGSLSSNIYYYWGEDQLHFLPTTAAQDV
jgi:hypothetical protein